MGRVTYINEVLKEAFSNVLDIDSFKYLVLNSKCYTEYSKLDHSIFISIEDEA